MSDNAMAADFRPRSFVWYLTLTALVCGALVMVIEVLGSRVIGPFFGVSLFVWTSLITVTLVALAAGYAVGGHLADRRDSPAYLYGIILTAGLLTFLIPLLRAACIRKGTCGLRKHASSQSTPWPRRFVKFSARHSSFPPARPPLFFPTIITPSIFMMSG